MAESVVSYAVQKLQSFLTAEVELQAGLKRELESLQNELASINVVLRDADRKADQRDDIKEWLRQVRKIAYQIEDVIDEYLLLKKQPHNSNQPQLNDCKLCIFRLGNVLVKAVPWILDLKPRHNLACTIKDIKSELVEIQRRKDSYRLVSTNSLQEDQKQGCIDYRGYYSTYLEDSELLGIEKPKSEVISKLYMDGSLIAVVGMGGVGKTTLIKKVFQDKQVCKHFGLKAWVSVSQSYKPLDVLRTLLKKFLEAAGEQESVINEVDNLHDPQIIIRNLRDFLQKQHKQRFLVVLDDIWDMELLPWIKDALPSNLDGRVLMTTRQIDVAMTWVKSLSGYVHELPPLPWNEAWDLFCIKTFGKRGCSQNLEDLSRQIVKKCEGLPLAIVAIGGFLSTKEHSYSTWNKLLNSIGSEITRNRELTSVKRILLLSYHELPYYLKPCFLYFCLLPEDYDIIGWRIIRIWMADGLVEPQRGKTIKEVGEEYMMELIQRNLVQVAEAYPIDHSLVRVHDILREIIISELEETGFGQLVPFGHLPMNRRFRRLAISSSDDSIKSTRSKRNSHKSNIRSLILVGNDVSLQIESLIKFNPLLKVLDLEDAPINKIPEEVGDLRLLRLLNLRGTEVKTLPKSIGRLVNLETLELRYCPIRELPKEMRQLYKLRYLCLGRYDDNMEVLGVKVPVEVVRNLKELQELSMIDIGGKKTSAAAAGMIIKELRNFKELRRFGISFRRDNKKEVSSLISEMEHLESLDVNSAHRDEIMEIEIDNKKTIDSLRCLYMYRGIMHKLPHWVSLLVNLVALGFWRSRLKEDPLPILGRLPNLVQLELGRDCYEGNQLDFGTSGFPKLQCLFINDLKELKSIIGSAPPLMQQGVIRRCPKLKEFPLEIGRLVHS